MPAVAAGPEIERLIQLLDRLPGLGPRSARRAALFLVKKREALMAALAAALQTAIEKIEVCRVCGNIEGGSAGPLAGEGLGQSVYGPQIGRSD